MPSKSKRNRRDINSNKKNINPTINTAPLTRTEKVGITLNNPGKLAPSGVSGQYLSKDLAWTGLVTAFIIVILIVAYVIFR